MAQTITINDPTDISGARVINGALLVTGNLAFSGNITASNPSVGPTAAPVPGNATAIGFQDAGGNLQIPSATNPLPISGNISVSPSANQTVDVQRIGGAPYVLGNNTAANSQPVVIATNQASIPVTPAANSTVVVTSGTVNANITGGNVTATIAANASVNVAQIGGAAYALGNNTAANSAPVVIATNQGTLPVNVTAIVANQSVNVSQVGGAAYALGNATAANSQPVVIATNQGSVPVTPAANSTVQVTNNVTTTIQANASVNVAQVGGAAYALGNATAAASAPVVIATNQGAVPVTLPANITANVTNNVTTTIQANASVNVNQVGGAAFALGNHTAAASLPVALATDQASIPVTQNANATVVVTSGAINANITGGNVTAAIVANASVNVAQVGGVAFALGNHTAANSIPVALATDQGSINVTQNANATINVSQIGGAAYALGNHTAANSAPVVIATDQGAIPVSGNFTANITGNQTVIGPVAANVTVAGAPVQTGYRAVTAEAVPNGNNTVINPVTDAVGKTINQPYANKENMLRGNATIANTTAVAITGMGAQGAAFKIYVTSIQAFRTDAGATLVYLTVNDTGNTTVPLPPNGGAVVNYPVPLALALNTAANITLSANITSALVSMQGYFGT